MPDRNAEGPSDALPTVSVGGPLSPRDVVRWARGDVSAAPSEDPRRPAIVRVGRGLDERAWAAFRHARRVGYLVVARAGRDDDGALIRLWGWWCAAARRPEAVLRVDRGGAVADLALDLSPAGVRFRPAALAAIGRGWRLGGGGRWLATEETVQLAGVPAEVADAAMRALLRVASDPRYVGSAGVMSSAVAAHRVGAGRRSGGAAGGGVV